MKKIHLGFLLFLFTSLVGATSNIKQNNDQNLTYNPKIKQNNNQNLTYNPNIKQSNDQEFNGNSEDNQTNNLKYFDIFQTSEVF